MSTHLKKDGLTFGAVGKVRRQICRVDTGECVFDSGFRKNLILDSFFSQLTSNANNPNGMADMIGTVTAGTGTTQPINTASNPITISQTATTATASSAFFTSGMVGQLLVYGASGTGIGACYITGFTNSTTVTVNVSQTISAQVAVVYNVAFTGVTGTTNTSTSYVSGSGNNFSTYAAGVNTWQKVMQFTPGASTLTYQQLQLNTRQFGAKVAAFLIPGAGDTVSVGFFYVVTWQIQMTVTPAAPTAVGNIGSGINTAGNVMLETVGGFSTIAANGTGTTAASWVLDGPSASPSTLDGWLGATSATFTQNTSLLATGSGPRPAALTGYLAGHANVTVALASPAQTGLCTITYTAAYNITGTGIVVGTIAFANNSTREVLADIQLTTPYTSPSGAFTFAFSLTSTITRVVTN